MMTQAQRKSPKMKVSINIIAFRAFHSCTLTSPELNYDTHDKKLLAIFEAFQKWQHYLEGSGSPMDVVMCHELE